jgi:CBS domain-containing protein
MRRAESREHDGVMAMDSKRHVRDFMSEPVKTLGRNDTLSVADSIMRNERIRHLPVLDDGGRVVGILSQRDLFFNALVRALGFGTATRDRTLNAILVKEVMTNDVITTLPDTLVRSAARVMVDRKIGCLPVLDGDVLIGMLSESDIVLAVANGAL